MEDIEMVIKIDENTYNRITSGFADEDDAVLFENLLKNGIPLPKGQGRLIERVLNVAETLKPKTGHWTERKIHETTGFFLPTCSECGKIQPYARHTFKWNYCPSCGAKMESEE